VANIGHVIAKLKSIDNSGLVAVSVVRPYVESIPKKTRKAELIKAKMTGSSLEVIAKAVGGTVQQATDLTMENTMLPNVGPEAKVVGSAFALNKISAPIRKQRCLCCKKREYCKSASLKATLLM
jgi:peptidyl-prolyl cis-trans isomerase D